MLRIFVLVFSILLIPTVFSQVSHTQDFDLNRNQAKDILRGSNYFPYWVEYNLPIGSEVNLMQMIQTTLNTDPPTGNMLNVGYACAKKLGHLEINPSRLLFNTQLYSIHPTTRGLEVGHVINKERFTYKQQYSYRLHMKNVYAVTGIRRVDYSSAMVDFIIRGEKFGEVAKCIHPNTGPEKTEIAARATLALYDDGWRVEKVVVEGQRQKWVEIDPN